MRLRVVRTLLVILALVAGRGVALAGDDYFTQSAQALSLGKYEEAIAKLEAYADREAPHPDASFNRGVAYLMRVRAGSERDGDLGRAAAAFEETLAMRPGDAEARDALELVRAEVAKRRSRTGKDVVVATPTIDRVVVGLLSPRGWSYLAIAASMLLAAGLGFRRFGRGPLELTGTLLIPISAVGLVAFLPAALFSTHLDRTTSAGVLVAREAYLSDATGRALGGDPVTEAARLEIGERRDAYVHVRYGSREGWLPADTVRVLRVR